MALNTVMSHEQIARVAPSVFASEAASNRSDRYTYIPTIDVLNGLQREGFEVMQAVQTRTRIADNREFTKHMLRLRHRDVLDRPLVAGQEIPEIVLVNSHDGTSAYKIMGGIFRLICSNGMVIGDTSFECSVRHSGDVINNVIEGSFEVVKGIERVMPVIDTWKQIKLEAPEKMAFAKAARALRWDDEDAPVTPDSLLVPQRYEDHKDDLFTVYNVAQEHLIKGGVRGRNKSARRMTTRAVTGVSENIKLNKSLWMLAQEMAAIKQAQG